MRALPVAVGLICAVGCKSSELPDRHVMSDGVDVVFHVAGSGPVTIVHAGGPGLDWRYVRMPDLEDHLTMVYIEPIGTGASGRLADPEGYTLHAYANSIEAVRTAMATDKVFLIGHSHGGKVAMQYAAEHAAHLRGLILYSASAVTDDDWNHDVEQAVHGFASEPWYAAAFPGLSAHFTAPNGYCFRLVKISPFYFADYTNRHEVIDDWVAKFRCWKVGTTHDEPHDDMRPRLAGLKVPTLVITGKRDWLFPEKYAKLTAQAIPGAQVTILEHSGHFGHLEEPAAFAKAVAEFTAAH
jgi:proline iminopeptidase